MRTSAIKRETAETKIDLTLCLEGGPCAINTGVGFLDHMLTLLAGHSRFGLQVTCKGDTNVDFHHTVEDIGIVLGKALKEAVGEKRGINRYGSFILPMDETLMICAIDLSGRSCLGFDAAIPTQKVGDFDTELVEEFMLGFCRAAECTLHFKQLAGTNSHHIIEAMFKALGRALKQAVAIDPTCPDAIPSTKGSL
jgi:imidazoleglycerol-phosphate dehydratase